MWTGCVGNRQVKCRVRDRGNLLCRSMKLGDGIEEQGGLHEGDEQRKARFVGYEQTDKRQQYRVKGRSCSVGHTVENRLRCRAVRRKVVRN